ncbi:hypothetical protein [Dyella sp. ASV21]|uniref:hypothetical protein n=1 Tax=Dyella sp. ASV21 TaxID=2795114 RepID=UPI0018EB5BD1|nr:hypothetical protein [Dyella sp. ASV21]
MNQSNNNPFGGLKSEGLEAARDVLGGGGAMDSGLYTGTIKLAYAGKSSGGAHSMTVVVDLEGREYRETLYVTNKQGQNYYEKAGKKNPLPGFTTANDLALLSTGVPLNEQEIEERVVKLYDFDAKAEVPTKVQAVVSMHGKPITLGILKQIVDKNVKNEATNTYVPSGETREENIIDKVFHAETGKTVSEFTLKVENAEFQGKWGAKNKGVTRDRSTGKAGKVGAPGQKAANDAIGGGQKQASKSLFG